ncbi:PSP1 domain-containing protein [Aureibacter tunicatorum]|uniref:Cell fate regulator YaaT (PSP1 superfamily) n=1 Tax=Aureibacter tunicatorum TaxID=866807 RepID=A0AAE3XKE5_9BACT|nr:regulatory iron-sulfur-containing complex subunit RicT [Aureibacter tunicatorum]MDR6238145.1 cell fate regulator YaaT (PSP1 superfamily) [Aureibacter tunicatorum]BDD03178.1 hypothetical protein AUTU_06610 [Aureibacter tunicatorum]
MSGCNSCASQGAYAEDGTLVSGCQSSGGCGTGGCNKLNTFDWLSDMLESPSERYDVIEVRFKGGKKEFYRNVHGLDLNTGDAVVVDVPNGHHIGYVSLQGELVRLQMRKKGVEDNEEIREIYRLANDPDMEKLFQVKKREMPTLYRTREIIQNLGLEMKLSDIEFQADNSKATFYYSADDRVDFRELIKVLAGEFKVRVEMRQISLRQEAGRLGGIGSCGRELCCSTWLSEFKSVSTSAARYQNLSLNPSKLSGQCGRLKCCLNYELETYIEALEDIPTVEGPIQTVKGEARLQKTDIFKKVMWFGYENENVWHPISVVRVKEILEQNKRGEKPETLLSDDDIEKKAKFEALASDLAKMDEKYSQESKKPNRKRRPKSKGASGNRPKTNAQGRGASSRKPNSGNGNSNQGGASGGSERKSETRQSRGRRNNNSGQGVKNGTNANGDKKTSANRPKRNFRSRNKKQGN